MCIVPTNFMTLIKHMRQSLPRFEVKSVLYSQIAHNKFFSRKNYTLVSITNPISIYKAYNFVEVKIAE